MVLLKSADKYFGNFTKTSFDAWYHLKVQIKITKTSFDALSHLFMHLFILIIFLMLLPALLNYISIILVKYHIFFRDFFTFAEMDITRVFSRLRRLN